VKALTIHQPWAWLIVEGHKRVENRPRAFAHRGPLAIHAGQRRGAQKYAAAAGGLDGLIDTLRAAGYPVPDADELTYGAVVGTVELVDVVRMGNEPRLPGMDAHGLASEPFATGPVCWVLAEPKRLAEPIPCRGKQGLFEVEVEVR